MKLGRSAVNWWLDPSRYSAPLVMTDHSLCGGTRFQFDRTRAGDVVRRVPNLVCVEQSGFQNASAYVREQNLRTRVWYIPNPVDTARFRSHALPESESLIVGYVGRAEKKGVSDVVDLAREAPEGIQFRLALAGTPATVNPAQESSRIQVEWNLPNDEMSEFYRNIHVFLDPWSFGAPRTALEALASGRPVVRIRQGPPHAEDLPAEVSPISTPDSASILQLLGELREDRDRLELLSRLSRDVAVQRFDASRIAESYRMIYHEIARD